MEAGAESGTAPRQQFPEDGPAPYPSPQYAFPPEHEFTNLEQTLGIAARDQPEKLDTQDVGIGKYMTMPVHNGHSDAVSPTLAPVDGPTSTGNGMPRPTTPINLSTKRKSLGDGDVTPSGGDSKRRRSKVSRACDQCRKKKIRCDADAGGTGELKTCSNCVKAGKTCDYARVPQKRGPSKGYIKELSERVQQVEGQLALHRSSFDSQPGAYGEAIFSPEDEAGPRRQSSFSQQRGPFSGFDRDRFPSSGGWNPTPVTSNPRHPSIAIPPDQTGPSQISPTSTRSTKPFWNEWTQPSAPIQKAPSEHEGLPEVDRALISNYYEVVHPSCAILPDSDTTTSRILTSASSEYRDHFLATLKSLPRKRQKPHSLNGDAPAASKYVEAIEQISMFFNGRFREEYSCRSAADNLVLLWTLLTYFIVLQHDVDSWRKVTTTQTDLVRLSLSLCTHYYKTLPTGKDLQHEMQWRRALHIAALLGRLTALSHGDADDPVPSFLSSYLTIDPIILPPPTSFVTLTADTLQASLGLLPQATTALPPSALKHFSRLRISNIQAVRIASGLPSDGPVVLETTALSDLLSLRYNHRFAQSQVIVPAVNLAEAVRTSVMTETGAEHGRYTFNPLSFHNFTLATMTLLELLQCDDGDEETGPMVREALESMKKGLATLVEQRNQLDEGTFDSRFWAQVLVDMIDERVKVHLETPAARARRKNEEETAIDLAALLQRGYANVLGDFVAR